MGSQIQPGGETASLLQKSQSTIGEHLTRAHRLFAALVFAFFLGRHSRKYLASSWLGWGLLTVTAVLASARFGWEVGMVRRTDRCFSCVDSSAAAATVGRMATFLSAAGFCLWGLLFCLRHAAAAYVFIGGLALTFARSGLAPMFTEQYHWRESFWQRSDWCGEPGFRLGLNVWQLVGVVLSLFEKSRHEYSVSGGLLFASAVVMFFAEVGLWWRQGVSLKDETQDDSDDKVQPVGSPPASDGVRFRAKTPSPAAT